MPRGGRRPGAGRPRKSLAEHERARTRPHYTSKPPETPKSPRIVGDLYSWPGLGHWGPDGPGIMRAIEDAWTPELEAAWPEERIASFAAPGLCTPRMVAQEAARVYLREWERNGGPEWAARNGIPLEAIERAFGRAPEPNPECVVAMPTPDAIVAWLADGWLLRWWTGDPTLTDEDD